MPTPVVSVVMPAYNAALFIEEAIHSVCAQSFTDWELHVVDDQSTDETPDIIAAMAAKDNRVHYHRLEQKGGGAGARNYAQRQAQGNYIAFLDADDVWHPHKLEKQLEFMRKQDAAFSFTSYGTIDGEGNPIGSGYDAPARITYENQLYGSSVGCSTAMYSREKCGIQLMPLVKKRQDFALWLQILRQVGEGYGLQEKLAFYRVHHGSLSSNKFSAAYYTWNVLRHVEKLPLFKASYCFCFYVIRALRKQLAYRIRSTQA